jgi:hypothetical protein
MQPGRFWAFSPRIPLIKNDNHQSGSQRSSAKERQANAAQVYGRNGDNPAIIHVGATYNDLGATIERPQADLNFDIKTFLHGALLSYIVLDTSQIATDTIDNVATDSSRLTSTSTRTVIVEPTALAPSTSPSGATTGSSTEATSSAQ